MKLAFGLGLTLTEKEFERLQSRIALFHDDAKPLEIGFSVYDNGRVQWVILRPTDDPFPNSYDIVSEGALRKSK
jgi:hypothetical protein